MKSWIKLWRKESTRFRSMPLSARTVAAYVLKFVDEGGALPLGKRDPVTAVALAVGAVPSERRWLRPAVEALVEHGYFAAQDGLLIVGNFPRYQEDSAPVARRSSVAHMTVDERSSDVSATLVERLPDAYPTLTRREIAVSGENHTLARNVLSSESEKTQTQTHTERVGAGEPGRLGRIAERARASYLAGLEKLRPGKRAPAIARGPGGDVWTQIAREVCDESGCDALFAAAIQDDFVINDGGWLPNVIRGAASRLLIDGPKRPGGKSSATQNSTPDPADARVRAIEAELATLDGEWGVADRREALERQLDAARADLRRAREVSA